MLDKIRQEATSQISQAKDLASLEQAYRQFLGKKGKLTLFLRSLKEMSEQDKKKKGKLANELRKELNRKFEEQKQKFQGLAKGVDLKEWIDVSWSEKRCLQGHVHPIALVQDRVEEIFQSMGFSVLDGPEVETEYYNFDALNIEKDHPARDMWDTFWLKTDYRRQTTGYKKQSGAKQKSNYAIARSQSAVSSLLLRTHTSPMQARYMEKNNPPLRIIVPGRCFRHEATDASHDVQFYQVEGLMVGSDVSTANFKAVIESFFAGFFEREIKVRLRPSYFPFTEPSFEVDIWQEKENKWLEIMGAGMVHQNVFKAVGYPRGKWQGFAFGMGIDRLAMLKYKVNDIRLFFKNDLRFLKQF